MIDKPLTQPFDDSPVVSHRAVLNKLGPRRDTVMITVDYMCNDPIEFIAVAQPSADFEQTLKPCGNCHGFGFVLGIKCKPCKGAGFR